MTQQTRKRVVIVGGGFGGLNAARSLRRADVDVVLIDRRNFHLFQPLLYQVATGSLSPANIAAPIRAVLERQRNAEVLLGEVVDVDVTNRSVSVRSFEPGADQLRVESVAFDWLILAAGATNNYFGNDAWEQFAPGLKTIEEATDIRGRIFSAFEAAEHEDDPSVRRQLMTFVVVGGGPTGVEMAGAIAELARKTLKDDFRRIDPADANIILIDAQPRMLEHFPQKLSDSAEHSLERLGVELRKGAHVTSIEKDRVELSIEGQPSTIQTRTVLWAAGVAAAPIGNILAHAAGVEVGRGGHVPVQPDLSVAGHPNLFVIGDIASCAGANGKPLPGVAQVAIQQGKYVGKSIVRQLKGKSVLPPFAYRDLGSLATIGRSAAVADVGKLEFSGFFAWLLWLFVHIMAIVQFQNRLLVLMQWGWSYFTYNRSARLITEQRWLEKGESPEKSLHSD